MTLLDCIIHSPILFIVALRYTHEKGVYCRIVCCAALATVLMSYVLDALRGWVD